MTAFELFLIAIGLSMDAFAIAICKGLSVQQLKTKHMIITGLWFGGSQAIMPLLGYLLGSSFYEAISSIDHWVSFFLLVAIGINMIRESREESKPLDASFGAKVMFPLAIADSIDALAAGIAFVFQEVSILPTIALIGTTTFLFSCAGVKIGNRFGAKYHAKAEIVGGIYTYIYLHGFITGPWHCGVTSLGHLLAEDAPFFVWNCYNCPPGKQENGKFPFCERYAEGEMPQCFLKKADR